ncbi:hypothetical protein P5V15_014017 [Pogonomyrmex californicus]
MMVMAAAAAAVAMVAMAAAATTGAHTLPYPGVDMRGESARDLHSHTDPIPVYNAERLCGITHNRGRHSETEQWRNITDRPLVKLLELG